MPIPFPSQNQRILFVICVILIALPSFSVAYDFRGTSPDDYGCLDPFISKIIESYHQSTIQGTRIFMETGNNIRYRYEFILRQGTDKIVTLKMPYSLTWYRKGNVGYIIQYGMREEVSLVLKDLEDVFLERIANETLDFNYSEINYTGIPAYYLFVQFHDDSLFRAIVLQESFQIIRIERQKTDLLSIMVYDNLDNAEERQFQRQINWYEAIPLAEEIAETESESINAELAERQLSMIDSQVPYINRIANEYSIIQTDLLEFKDGRAVFLTIDTGMEAPVGVTIIQLYEGMSFHNIPLRLEDKVPQDYTVYQKRKGLFEVTVVGKTSVSQLEGLCNHILSLLPQDNPPP